MASTSARLLQLLSLLGARDRWPAAELAVRLGVSPRTLRRDIESLRALDYPVDAVKGPDGGYQLGAGGRLPPLLLDDEQAVAVAVALQTAPRSVAGIDDAVSRALTSIREIMPAHRRAQVDGLHLTAIWNPWEFAAPPLAAETLQAVGYALRTNQLLRFDQLDADGRRSDPSDPDHVSPRVVEPHHLVVWAGRWYLVAFVLDTDDWSIVRLDRIRPLHPTGRRFARRELPSSSVATFVMTTPDRGDTAARWPCLGSAVLPLPAELVARWAPGGSVVERVADDRTRLTLGAWSWAGIAGLLATFDTAVSEVEPAELRAACATVAERYAHLA